MYWLVRSQFFLFFRCVLVYRRLRSESVAAELRMKFRNWSVWNSENKQCKPTSATPRSHQLPHDVVPAPLRSFYICPFFPLHSPPAGHSLAAHSFSDRSPKPWPSRTMIQMITRIWYQSVWRMGTRSCKGPTSILMAHLGRSIWADSHLYSGRGSWCISDRLHVVASVAAWPESKPICTDPLEISFTNFYSLIVSQSHPWNTLVHIEFSLFRDLEMYCKFGSHDEVFFKLLEYWYDWYSTSWCPSPLWCW